MGEGGVIKRYGWQWSYLGASYRQGDVSLVHSLSA